MRDVGPISADGGAISGSGVAVYLCVDLKVRCLFRRVDLTAVDIMFNSRVRKEGVGYVVLAKLKDE